MWVFHLNISFIMEKINYRQRWLFKLYISGLFPSVWVLHPHVCFIIRQIAYRAKNIECVLRGSTETHKGQSYYKRSLYPNSTLHTNWRDDKIQYIQRCRYGICLIFWCLLFQAFGFTFKTVIRTKSRRWESANQLKLGVPRFLSRTSTHISI